MSDYTLADLEHWMEICHRKAMEFGLDCFDQEFEVCDHNQMLGYMAYSGLPSHYPHWSYGKSYEQQKTKYDYGVSGLPYEMVINTNPSLAYLMRDNSLLLQILTLAHVYGHNDFFKNNFTFQTTRPEFALERFKVHANRMRSYVEDPGIGIERVEEILDAAHALSFQRNRNLATQKRDSDQQKEKMRQDWLSAEDQGEELDDGSSNEQSYRDALRKTPLEPDEDLLLFIRDHNPHLEDWQKDVLNIVDEEACYFIPQIQTKIMNEGWASYWHKKIVESIDLSGELRMEFIIRHAQVLRPHPGGLNPYHMGFKLWDSLRIWYDGSIDRSSLREDEFSLFDDMQKDYDERDTIPPGTGTKSGHEMLFQVRHADRDSSFLRQFLTPVLMKELDLFQHEADEKDTNTRVITKVSDSENWRGIKDVLVGSVGTGGLPVIKVEDANHSNKRILLLKHAHDGRDLELNYAQKTLQYVKTLWGNPVALETSINGKAMSFLVDSDGKIQIKGATRR